MPQCCLPDPNDGAVVLQSKAMHVVPPTYLISSSETGLGMRTSQALLPQEQRACVGLSMRPATSHCLPHLTLSQVPERHPWALCARAQDLHRRAHRDLLHGGRRRALRGARLARAARQGRQHRPGRPPLRARRRQEGPAPLLHQGAPRFQWLLPCKRPTWLASALRWTPQRRTRAPPSSRRAPVQDLIV